ncbi:hypothetical protein [Iodobacter violaceini]|uniref:hypothetical protein n=1 Tax=Iodobacter violaceini TaxID=3044271 RepID=UPI001421092F|nr:hypothetical protein [Iodobacter violacea]
MKKRVQALSAGLLPSPENTQGEKQAGWCRRQFVFERSEMTQRHCPQRGDAVFLRLWLRFRFLAAQEMKAQRDARTKINVPKALKRSF